MRETQGDPRVLASLAEAVGAAHVLTDPAETAAYLVERRGLYVGTPLAVVQPANTAEVAAVLRICHEARVPVVPQGGNTGLVGGQIPDESGRELVLSTRRLDRVREVDKGTASMT